MKVNGKLLKATDAAAVAPDAPADLDADALAFVQEMRRRR